MDKYKYGDHLDDEFFETQKAESSKAKIWEELDINKSNKKPHKSYWLILLGSGVVLLLSWYLWSKYNSDLNQNEKLEIRYAELQEQYNNLSKTNENLTNQIAVAKLDQETVTNEQPKTRIEREVVIEYKDKVVYKIDTVFIDKQPKIVYEDRVIRDTVYLERIVEIQADVLTASANEPEKKVKRRGEELIFHLENRTNDSGGSE